MRKFRDALDLTQREFSRETGFTEGMISRWERGEEPSEKTVEILKNYVVKKGRPELALVLDPRPFSPKRIILPPKEAGAAVDVHSLLDEVLESGDDQAKLAVENFLFITTQYLRGGK